MNDLDEFMLDGKKVYVGGAPPHYQVVDYDERGIPLESDLPDIAHIYGCVKAAIEVGRFTESSADHRQGRGGEEGTGPRKHKHKRD